MKTQELKRVPNFGEILTDRTKSAGFKEISLENHKELKELYQIGSRRTENVERYLKWKERNGRYLVERNEEYDIYSRLNACIINFNVKTEKAIYYRVVMVLNDSGTISGNMHILLRKNNQRAKLGFGGNSNGAVWREHKVNGNRETAPITISDNLRENFRRILEVGFNRFGRKTNM